jgi:hypothetical protein
MVALSSISKNPSTLKPVRTLALQSFEVQTRGLHVIVPNHLSSAQYYLHE